jgi:hypothetical protein
MFDFAVECMEEGERVGLGIGQEVDNRRDPALPNKRFDRPNVATVDGSALSPRAPSARPHDIDVTRRQRGDNVGSDKARGAQHKNCHEPLRGAFCSLKALPRDR